ncbi:hypothetical protein K9M79_07955 [Candidatus Woesearchaeota archaeon]|nr:hypothetical protein [Candidatus Woesearchaeota archaeon]
MAFQNTILNIDYSMDIKVMRIDLAQDVKRVLFKCYGYPIPLNISTYECPIPMGDGDITIKGIKLEQLEFGICDAEIMRDQVPIDFDQSIIYTVPIFNNHTYCPGSLTIYI